MDTTIGMPYKKNIIHLTVGKRGIFIKGKMKNICFGMVVGLLFCVSAGSIGYWFLTGQSQAESPRKTQKQQATTEEDTKTVEATAGSQAEEKRPAEETLVQEEQKTAAAKPEKSEEELFEEQIAQIMADMTVEEKVLQLFMITPEALTGHQTVTAAGEQTREAILQYPVGGIVYFAKNLKEPAQVKTMLQNTRQYYEEAGAPAPFLGVDEEGGNVARIGSQQAFGVERILDMRSVGDGSDPKEASRVGTVIGDYLSDLGFNLDFAPVADVLTNPDNQVIGRRSFGTDPELVAEFALAEAEGLETAGVWAVFKHYPGHGATLGDSHDGYAYTDKNLEQLMEAELVPFIKGIEKRIPFIMAAHISVPSITGDPVPCTLSHYMITEVLREKLGYEGIVVTDAMNMGAVSQQYDSAEASVLALQAGVDLILMPADFLGAFQGVLDALETGELSTERVDESVRRILRVKYGKNQSL